MEYFKGTDILVSGERNNKGIAYQAKDDIDENLLFEHVNRAYDASPTSQKLLLAGDAVHSNTLQIDTIISRDNSSHLLSVSDSKRPSSVASSHLNLNASGFDVDDHVISVLSYGAYGALLLVLAILTTIFLLCFG